VAWNIESNWWQTQYKKCFWSNFQLQYDPKGHPSIRAKQPNDPKLLLTNSDGTHETLRNTLSNEGICHLGVHISMDGSQTTKEKCSTNAVVSSKKYIKHVL